jgi:hypothetical protein
MQISSGSNGQLPPAPERTVSMAAAPAAHQSTDDDNTVEPTRMASQDASVTISPEGAATAAHAAQGTQAASASQDAGKEQGNDGGKPTETSAVKSFAYGALGLERPDESQATRNEFYTAGKWLAAGLTIGGLISLFV